MTQIFQLFENFSQSAMFLLSFGSILHELEQNEINSLSSFLSEWEKNSGSTNPYAIDMSEDETRVRVLTVHKAKGLEFPVVIVPVLDKRISGEKNLFWEEGHFYYITKDFARINPDLKRMYLKEIKREFIDELNLLYVALTRARDALFIPVVYQPPSKPPTTDEFKRFKDFSELIANCVLVQERLQSDPVNSHPGTWKNFSFGQFPEKTAVSFPREKESELLPVYSKNLSTSAWQKDFLVFKPSDWLTEEEKMAKDRGEAIHRVLSNIELIKDPAEIGDMVKPLAEMENLSENDTGLLVEFLKKDSVLPFFQGDIEIHNEIEVAGTINGQIEYRRIDRLIVKDDEVFVVDYKTGHQIRDEYFNQVKEYKQILKPLFPDKRLCGYLLFVDSGRVEEI
jgi:ATP-dependent exoDNAse (exonuclease V) beta subunit